jgi:hypothetical protein
MLEEAIGEVLDNTNRYYLLSNLGDVYEPKSLHSYIHPYSDNSLGMKVQVDLNECWVEFKCGIKWKGDKYEHSS